MLNWLQRFSIFAYLDNNTYPNLYNRYELLIGAGAQAQFSDAESIENALGQWLFGHIDYDVKNDWHPKLESNNLDFFENIPMQFFAPEVVLQIPYGTHSVIIESDTQPEAIWGAIQNAPDIFPSAPLPSLAFERNFDKEKYCETVNKIKEHIVAGDCYELNLCVANVAESAVVAPFSLFYELNRRNPAPYACLYRQQEHWLVSSSPERFLFKQGSEIVAQPMKGTIARGKNAEEDAVQKRTLQQDIKERAENVMIVDLMRNDLSKSCKTATVKALELFGVYTFPTLHTMVSTIKGVAQEDIKPLHIIKNTFPTGSMTGAPKHIVMQIIEDLELAKRSLFSGAVGYFDPNGDFDFNVVIRSFLYNENSQKLSYQTGGAITIDSIPEKEWEEVLLKSKALESVFLG